MKRQKKFKEISFLLMIVITLCNDFILESSANLADFIKEIDQLDTPKDFNLPFTLKIIIKSQSIISEKYNLDLSSEFKELHATYHSLVLSSKFYKNDAEEMHQKLNAVHLNESKDVVVPMTVRMKIVMGKNEKCDPSEIENCFISQYISKYSCHFGMVVFSLAEILELVDHLNLQSSLVEANGFQKSLSNKNAHIFLGNKKDLLNLYHDRVLNSKLKTEDVPPGFKFLRNFRVKFGIDLETGHIFTEHLEKMVQIQIKSALENHQQFQKRGFIQMEEAVKHGEFTSPFILREKFMNMGTFGIRHHFMKMDKRDEYGHDYIGAAYNLAVAASRVHNFSWIMTPYPLNTELLEDGSWNGYMGDLIDDKIFSFTFHAAPYGSEIETSISTWSYVSAVEFLRGRPTASINWKALYAPFSRSVWFLTFVTVVLLIVVFTLSQTSTYDQVEDRISFFETIKGKSESLTNELQQKQIRLKNALGKQRQSIFEMTMTQVGDENESEEIQQHRMLGVAQELDTRVEPKNQNFFKEATGNSHLWKKVKLIKMWKPGTFRGNGDESWKKNIIEKPGRFKMSMIHESLLLTLAPLLSQGWKVPKRARSLALIWIFMSFVLSNFYQSDLLSLITIPTPEPIPQTFEELDRRRDMKVTLMYLPGIPCDLL